MLHLGFSRDQAIIGATKSPASPLTAVLLLVLLVLLFSSLSSISKMTSLLYTIPSTIGSAMAWFLIRYAAVVIMLYVFSTVSSFAGFAARILIAVIFVAICALYGVFVSIALRLSGGNRWQYAQWATGRAYMYAMRYLTDFMFVIDDPKNVLGKTRPAVFVGNHQTALDVLMLGSMFPKYCSVTAKRQLRKYPFLGWFMSLSGTIFIDRTNRQDARAAMRGAATAIQKLRQSVFMFPEGTRSNAQEAMLLPFKKGAFHLAVQAGVPIVPVIVANYSHLYSTANSRFLPGRIPVKVLDPIPTTGLTTDDVTELTERVRDLMLKELVALTARARAEPRYKVTESAHTAPMAVPAAPVIDAKRGVSSGVDTSTL